MHCSLFSLVTTAAAIQPHLVLFVVDDLGWADVGYHGSEYATPNIDHLANSGVRLERYYTQPVCSPTRSTWMTGRPVHDTGYYAVLQPGTHAHLPETPTLAEKLSEVGYKTHMLGKWHLGYDSWNATPTGRGFSTHFGYLQGAQDYYTKDSSRDGSGQFDFWDNQRAAYEYEGGYSLTQYMDRAEQLISEHDKSKPFFLYFAHQTIHAPILGLPEPLKSKYEARCGNSSNPLRLKYCSMMTYLDDTVQDFVNMLVNANMWDNTLMLFTTDNGGIPQNSLLPSFIRGAGCNYPLRSGKGTFFEGGVRGTAFFQGGFLPKDARGTARHGLMHTTDVYSTFLSIAGATSSQEGSIDQWNMISKGFASARKSIVLNVGVSGKSGGSVAVISGDMKYMSGINGPSILEDGYFSCADQKKETVPRSAKGSGLLGLGALLFNLTSDPNERTNLIKDLPDVASQLEQLAAEAAAKAVAPQPTDVDPLAASYLKSHNSTMGPWCASAIGAGMAIVV